MLVPIALLLGPLRHVAGRPRRRRRPAAVEAGTGYLTILRSPAVVWITALTFLSSFVGYGQMEAGFPAFARAGERGVDAHDRVRVRREHRRDRAACSSSCCRRIDGHRRTRVFLCLVGLWAAAWLLLGATGLVAGTLAAAAGVIVFHVLFGLGETMLQPTVPAIVNDLASDRDRGPVQRRVVRARSRSAPSPRRSSPGCCSTATWAGCSSPCIVAGLGGVAVLALALERRITPEVNGIVADR